MWLPYYCPYLTVQMIAALAVGYCSWWWCIGLGFMKVTLSQTITLITLFSWKTEQTYSQMSANSILTNAELGGEAYTS